MQAAHLGQPNQIRTHGISFVSDRSMLVFDLIHLVIVFNPIGGQLALEFLSQQCTTSTL